MGKPDLAQAVSVDVVLHSASTTPLSNEAQKCMLTFLSTAYRASRPRALARVPMLHANPVLAHAFAKPTDCVGLGARLHAKRLTGALYNGTALKSRHARHS